MKKLLKVVAIALVAMMFARTDVQAVLEVRNLALTEVGFTADVFDVGSGGKNTREERKGSFIYINRAWKWTFGPHNRQNAFKYQTILELARTQFWLDNQTNEQAIAPVVEENRENQNQILEDNDSAYEPNFNDNNDGDNNNNSNLVQNQENNENNRVVGQKSKRNENEENNDDEQRLKVQKIELSDNDNEELLEKYLQDQENLQKEEHDALILEYENIVKDQEDQVNIYIEEFEQDEKKEDDDNNNNNQDNNNIIQNNVIVQPKSYKVTLIVAGVTIAVVLIAADVYFNGGGLTYSVIEGAKNMTFSLWNGLQAIGQKLFERPLQGPLAENGCFTSECMIEKCIETTKLTKDQCVKQLFEINEGMGYRQILRGYFNNALKKLF